MANLISITVQKVQGIASTEPKAISAAGVRMVRPNGSDAIIYYYDDNAHIVKEIHVDESVGDLKTAINATDQTVNEVSLEKIDLLHVADEKILINDAYIVLIEGLDNQTKSRIHLDLGHAATNTLLDVKESPSAVVAGSTSP